AVRGVRKCVEGVTGVGCIGHPGSLLLPAVRSIFGGHASGWPRVTSVRLVSPRRPPKRLVEASEKLAELDPVMAEMLERIGPCDLRRGRGRLPHFAELARAINYQQLAGRAAAAIHGRFVALFDGDSPTPQAGLALPGAPPRSPRPPPGNA